MATRRPKIPSLVVGRTPTPLDDRELNRLVRWITTLQDEFLPAYCLYWGLQASKERIAQLTGRQETVEAIDFFPDVCRKRLGMSARKVIGHNDLHTAFQRVLCTDFQLLLATPLQICCCSGGNHLVYSDSISKLREQTVKREILELNRHPSLLNDRCPMPAHAEPDYAALAHLLLQLPEAYEKILWLYFVGHKSIKDIHQQLQVQLVRGVIEYSRKLFSTRLGLSDPLDNASMEAILRRL